MDLTQASAYFDTQALDVYNFTTQSWDLAAITGQVKNADQFTSIWARPPRRRMLNTIPSQEVSAASNVIRIPETGDIYLVGTRQRDIFRGVHYRTTCPIHLVAGTAVITRKQVVGPPNDPGPVQDTAVVTTFADSELRSQEKDPTTEFFEYGNFFLTLPAQTLVQDNDWVALNGRNYRIQEVYLDSGFLYCRASDRPYDRVTITYTTTVGTLSYNVTTGVVSSTPSVYQVTAKVSRVDIRDQTDTVVTAQSLRIDIEQAHIGVTPKLHDKITVGGIDYRVTVVSRDPLSLEWSLRCQL